MNPSLLPAFTDNGDDTITIKSTLLWAMAHPEDESRELYKYKHVKSFLRAFYPGIEIEKNTDVDFAVKNMVVQDIDLQLRDHDDSIDIMKMVDYESLKREIGGSIILTKIKDAIGINWKDICQSRIHSKKKNLGNDDDDDPDPENFLRVIAPIL